MSQWICVGVVIHAYHLYTHSLYIHKLCTFINVDINFFLDILGGLCIPWYATIFTHIGSGDYIFLYFLFPIFK